MYVLTYAIICQIIISPSCEIKLALSLYYSPLEQNIILTSEFYLFSKGLASLNDISTLAAEDLYIYTHLRYT